MILLWGVAGDRPLSAVRAALQRIGAPVFFLNQHEVLRSELEFSVDGTLEGLVKSPAGEVTLERITAAYVRPYESTRLAELDGAAPEVLARALLFDDALLSWTELTAARVVNRPSAMASNQSKPHQLAMIHAQGFRVPETLVTTDVEALEAFREKHGEVIYKSISGVRSIVTLLTPDHRSRLDSLAHSPVQFQQRVAGTDVRVHVTGNELFACEVGTSAVDYRYPLSEEERPEIVACDLPDKVADNCLRLATAFELPVAGVDLRRTPDGDWYCFEVNPSPAFTFYEDATGQPIADAVARLLAAPALAIASSRSTRTHL